METKRIKIEDFCVSLNHLPLNILYKILGYLPLCDQRNLTSVNQFFHSIVSQLLKDRTYLYISKQKEANLNDIQIIRRQFSEIFFHGNLEKNTIEEVLKKFGQNAKKIQFGKNDLRFIKISPLDMISWLRNIQETIHLNTLNIKMDGTATTNETVTLLQLKKLRCCDTFLSVLDTPKLEDIQIFSTDRLKKQNLENINNFLVRHHSIKKFSFRIFCGVDIEIQDIDFQLNHLNLTHLKLSEFRYNPKSVVDILQNQKNLFKLHLEDGYLTQEDIIWSRQYEPIFHEILNLKKINKLVVEIPSLKLVRNLRKMTNLKRLHMNAITLDVLNEFLRTDYPHLSKLCLEGIDFGTRGLKKEDIWLLSQNFKNLTHLKFDSVPLSVIDCMVKNMENLKVIKIIRNAKLLSKMKSLKDDNLQIIETRLEKIICEQEDFRTRILPIIKISPNLREVKIYWNNKQTPIMTIIFDILEKCLQIDQIEFKYNGLYAKDNAILFSSHFNFSLNNRHYQVMICRKTGKILCSKF
ncbi:unnamed protein product [Chironomus riparius]|uniref:F-box domain-containing protein n=1 Tax=Chironomus riparius TaxID=315576 RepID=A0A9N9RUI3_9DIPT|nr:unnamed protein product [Chironomus riparius]